MFDIKQGNHFQQNGDRKELEEKKSRYYLTRRKDKLKYDKGC